MGRAGARIAARWAHSPAPRHRQQPGAPAPSAPAAAWWAGCWLARVWRVGPPASGQTRLPEALAAASRRSLAAQPITPPPLNASTQIAPSPPHTQRRAGAAASALGRAHVRMAAAAVALRRAAAQTARWAAVQPARCVGGRGRAWGAGARPNSLRPQSDRRLRRPRHRAPPGHRGLATSAGGGQGGRATPRPQVPCPPQHRARTHTHLSGSQL